VSRYWPFIGPQAGEVADLIAALADIPRFGDQLQLLTTGSCCTRSKKRGKPVHVVQFARERGRQVEAKTVHVHIEDPVSQRIHDQLQVCGWRT